MIGVRGYIRLGLIGAVIFSGAAAYTLFLNNQNLKAAKKDLQDQVQSVEQARERDAVASSYRQFQLEQEKDKLIQNLESLSEITDDDGTNYLNIPVPDSVRELFRED